MKTTRFFIVLLVVSSVIFLRWFYYYDQSLTGIDDANIYFVYAKNLSEGSGFVYNPGGERVEGFTSFLWTLILSIFYLAGPMEILALFLNLFLVSYTLSQLTAFADSLNKPSASNPMGFAGWGILSFICLIPGYLDWTVLTLMETGLWSSLLVLITLLLLKLFREPENKPSEKGLLYLIPLLIWTRPESIAWGLIFIAIRFGQLLYQSHSFSDSFRKTMPVFAAYFVPLVVLFIFRLSYFGYPFPNTYYAKVSYNVWNNVIDGFYYLWRYVKENPFIPVFLLLYGISFILIANTLIRKKAWLYTISAIQFTILLIVGVQFLIPFYTGGDHFYLSRFFQPLYPILLLGVFNISFWQQHTRLKVSKLSIPQAGFLLVSLCLLITASTRFSLFQASPILKEFKIAQYGRETGERLNSLFENSTHYPSVGTYLAGGLAYRYNGKTVDLLGLNNTLIAHSPKDFEGGYKNHSAFNKAAFYKLMPDMVHMDFIESLNQASLNEYDSTDFQNQVYKYIFQDEEFRAKYVPAVIMESEESWYQAYVQEKYLDTLRKNKHKFYVFSRKKKHQEEQVEYLLHLSYFEKIINENE